MLPLGDQYLHWGIAVEILFSGCKIWGIYLVVKGDLCCILFIGEHGNINFKMKITFL